MFLSANVACRLTYRCIEDTLLLEDDESDEDITSSSQPSHVLDIAGTTSERKARSADNVVSPPMDDDITQYARVQIYAQSCILSADFDFYTGDIIETIRE